MRLSAIFGLFLFSKLQSKVKCWAIIPGNTGESLGPGEVEDLDLAPAYPPTTPELTTFNKRFIILRCVKFYENWQLEIVSLDILQSSETKLFIIGSVTSLWPLMSARPSGGKLHFYAPIGVFFCYFELCLTYSFWRGEVHFTALLKRFINS